MEKYIKQFDEVSNVKKLNKIKALMTKLAKSEGLKSSDITNSVHMISSIFNMLIDSYSIDPNKTRTLMINHYEKLSNGFEDIARNI